MKNPLDSVRGTIISGLLMTVCLVVAVRIYVSVAG
jgi:hypothetical protein